MRPSVRRLSKHFRWATKPNPVVRLESRKAIEGVSRNNSLMSPSLVQLVSALTADLRARCARAHTKDESIRMTADINNAVATLNKHASTRIQQSEGVLAIFSRQSVPYLLNKGIPAMKLNERITCEAGFAFLKK